ncbi:MAG: cobalamin-independent methionine synthase II family protein [Chloroflexi bacterium]|nr:cobalamin-independent methionine synthase II family protein [Chloroflexota bacterium]
MSHPTLKELGLEPLCPTVIGSAAFPGWYAYFQSEVEQHPERFGPDDLREAWADAVRIAVGDEVRAGIELVTDGEMGRVDFNLGFYDYLSGLHPQPPQRKLGTPAHDQRGKYTCIEPLGAPIGLGTLNEFRHLKGLTNLPIKMPVPGPFTLAGRLEGGEVYPDRRAVTEALIPIINAEMKALAAAGCRFIQMDEPSYAVHPEDPNEFVDFINRTLEGVEGVFIGMHMCFGNYRARAVGHRSYAPLFPGLLRANVDQFALEFASREMAEIELLEPIVAAGKSVAVGLVDVKNLWVEPVELITERIRTCLRYAPAEALHITPDCGFSQTARYAALGKMQNLARAWVSMRNMKF